MPAYNFKRQWRKALENGFAQVNNQPLPYPDEGIKRQTIRKPRKRPTKPGDIIYGKVGMRTSKCEALGQATCTDVGPLIINGGQSIDLDGIRMTPAEVDYLVKADGFDSIVKFFEFFEYQYGFPVVLELIKW